MLPEQRLSVWRLWARFTFCCLLPSLCPSPGLKTDETVDAEYQRPPSLNISKARQTIRRPSQLLLALPETILNPGSESIQISERLLQLTRLLRDISHHEGG